MRLSLRCQDFWKNPLRKASQLDCLMQNKNRRFFLFFDKTISPLKLNETNIFAPENEWLKINFIAGWPVFRGYLSFREGPGSSVFFVHPEFYERNFLIFSLVFPWVGICISQRICFTQKGEAIPFPNHLFFGVPAGV